MKKAVLAGYYGFQNMGDEALLEVLVLKLKELNPKIKIVALANNPQETSKRLRIEAVDRAKLLKIIKALWGSDRIIFGGGGLFQDVTSFRSLLYYLGLITIAKIMRNKIFLIAQGIGPLKRKMSRRLLSIVFKLADEISVRDKNSFEILSELYQKRITVTSDPAMLLAVHKRDIKIEDNNKKIIISLRKSPLFTKSKKDMLVQVLKKLIKEEDLELVFLPFHGENDKKVSLEIINMLDGNGKLEEPKTMPQYLVRTMEGAYGVIGMRLHSLVFSAILDIPFVGISYDPKIISFCKSFDSPVLDLETFNPIDLEKAIKEILTLRQTYSKRIKEKMEIQKQDINNYLNRVLK